jgi:predicted N-acetyltransferase YhbS
MDSAVLPSTLTLSPETRFDARARESLLDAAFGPARFEKTCERLREGRLPAFALVIKDGVRLVGTIRLWHVMAGGVPALMLGPLAVAQSHEGRGLGSKLMRYALNQAAAAGHRAIILVGDEAYYRRFGFARGLTENLVLPGPVDRERFLALELTEGALDDAFGLVVATGERATFLAPSVRSSALERMAA